MQTSVFCFHFRNVYYLTMHGTRYSSVPCFLHDTSTLALRTWDLSWFLKENILIITLLPSENLEKQNFKWELEQTGLPLWYSTEELTRGCELGISEEKKVWLTNYSLFKEVWDLLAVWAEIQNNFSIFPNSSPLPNYSSQMNVLLPSEIKQSRKEIIMHFHLEHRILIPFFLLLTDLSIFLLTCFKYDKFYLSQYHSSSIKLHKKLP